MEARFEDKYPLTNDTLHAFRFWMSGADGARFRSAFPTRIVNSIYFDSQEMSSYVDNVEGAGERLKVRLRWYGDRPDPEQFRFEIKTRSNSAGSKHLVEIPGADLSLQPYRSLTRRLRRLLPGVLRPALDRCSVPVLISRYSREYYATAEGIRLTVDSDVRSRKLIGRGLRAPHAMPRSIVSVVEVKYATEDAPAARHALASFPVSVWKNSKYARAVESWV